MSEHDEQIALVAWARAWSDEYPELGLLFHIPNGGWRHKATAGRLKAMGAQAGVPDLFLPVPHHGKAGLWIEMKYGHNKPTDKQAEWLDRLRAEGYCCRVCYSAEEAKGEILEYLGIGGKHETGSI